MDVVDVVKYCLEPVVSRPEIFQVSCDRGLKAGMKIEKWILVEMTARLKELVSSGKLDACEGEHKYPIKKTSRYEHCDLWWRTGGVEHWLEVKTKGFDLLGNIDRYENSLRDLDKVKRLRHSDVFHHLTLDISLQSGQEPVVRARFSQLFEGTGMVIEDVLFYDTWPRQQIACCIATLRR